MQSRFRTVRDLHTDETGAQVVEYAMLGAVAAAACGTLVAIIKGGVLSSLVQTVTQGMTQWVQSWFA